MVAGAASNPGMDDEEREAVRAEGFDPDDPAVVAARWIVCGGNCRCSYRVQFALRPPGHLLMELHPGDCP